MSTIPIEKNVMVPMRDGVRLATDVYRMEGEKPAPVLLARTPYDRERILAGSDTFDILRAVQAGYTVVAQDVRGRIASEGECNPHFQEIRDGVDTFARAAAQPWSSGVVGTFGGSYLGGTQWLPAREQPPALQAMAPAITFSDGYEGLTYQGGAKVLPGPSLTRSTTLTTCTATDRPTPATVMARCQPSRRATSRRMCTCTIPCVRSRPSAAKSSCLAAMPWGRATSERLSCATTFSCIAPGCWIGRSK